MKTYVKRQLERVGVRLNLVKNLWYLNSFILLKKKGERSNPVILMLALAMVHQLLILKNYFQIPLFILLSLTPGHI